MKYLFTIDYDDSPFEHGWQQYAPNGHHNDCIVVRKDLRSQLPILVKTGGLQSAISYPGLGDWLRLHDTIYIVTLRADSDFFLYFNVRTVSGKSLYLVYVTTGTTGVNAQNEYVMLLKGKNFLDGSWHSFIINIEKDLWSCFEEEFQHLNWICMRGNVDILSITAVSNQSELQDVRSKLLSPLEIDAKDILDSLTTSLKTKEIAKKSILFIAADPTNASRLRLGEEFREIQEKLKLAQSRDQFKLHLPQLSVRPADISQALLDAQPQIVHFSGHGASTGALCFESQTGQIQLVQPDALAALFELFTNQVSCVLLNACYSGIQAKAIAEHIEYVIGINQ